MRAFLLLLSLILIGCAHTAYNPDPVAARTVSVYGGGGLSGGWRCVADGRFLVSESYESDGHGSYPLHRRTKTSLSPVEWSEFWRSIDALRIERWKSRYSTEGMGVTICDAPGWTVDLRKGGKSFHREGEAAYPRLADPRHRTLDGEAVNRLFEIFKHYKSTPET